MSNFDEYLTDVGSDFDVIANSSGKTNSSSRIVNVSEYLRPEDVPFIPHSISPNHYMDLIPNGFEDQVQVYLDTDNTIVIKMLKPENESYNEVRLRTTLYNSEGTIVPYFLFEKSSVSKTQIDYLGKDRNLVLTMGQMIYLTIAHRLTFYKGYNVQFPYLLQKDFKALADYLEYEPAVAYNAQQKNDNTFVVIPASKHMKEFPYGNFLTTGCKPSEEEWSDFLADVKYYLLPSSDTAMHKRAKVVMAMDSIYRSVGYSHDSKKGEFYCIFEAKQNLSARLKTHLFGEAKRLLKGDLSIYQQDCIVKRDAVTGQPKLLPKDDTLKKAIVLFSPMDFESKRFVAGEAEVSANIADTMVVNIDSVNVSFTGKDHSRVEHNVGKMVNVPRGKRVLLGYDKELEPVYLHDVEQYKILSISQSSTAGLSKVKYEAVQKAGNARIISNTGLKFVSKVMTEMGTVYLPKPNEDTRVKAKFAPTVEKYLKEVDQDALTKFKKIKTTEFEGMFELKPDVIVGMNAVKANSKDQCNSIALAQAALAVELGYYNPKSKFGFDGLLDTLNEEEINEARKTLPEFVYVNRFGQREKVYVGLAYLNFTELGSVYSTFKPQSFAFMSGKNISVNHPGLNQHIFDNYLDKDMIEIVHEFYKILNDPKGRFRIKEKLPKYRPEDIRKKDKNGNMMFNHAEDLILSPIALRNYAGSKLLDENWNKGFYLDLTKHKNGMLIRVPCAKTLNRFVGSLPDGTYSFHAIIVNVSKMIENIIGSPKYPNPSIGFLYDNTRKVGSERPRGKNRRQLKTYDLYMDSIQGGLYSNEDSAMMIIQSLIKPKINGIGMKQVVEPLLPDDVIVITDDRKYVRLMRECYTDEEIDQNKLILQEALYEDSDEFVDVLFDNLSVDDMELSTEQVNKILNDVPYALAIRDPSLWEMQCQKARIWNRRHFALWLSRQSKKMELDTYLSPKHNRDICLVSSYIALASKSDCDGDRLPIFCLNREGQKLLREFELNNVLPEEQEWISNYIEKEYTSTKKLHINNPEAHVYKLYKISCQFDNTGKGNPSNYPQFLFNAMIAKGNIGPATIDMWALYSIFECYQAYCKEYDYRYIVNGKDCGTLPQVLTEQDKKKLSFVHVMLVQGNVIEAVKHSEGGSQAFKKYFLDGMTEKENIDYVRNELVTPVAKGGYGLNPEEANKMLFIVQWAKETNLLKAVKNFITKYNKGKLPADPKALDQWEDFIQANTYFGNLMKSVFFLKKDIDRMNEEVRIQTQKLLESGNASVGLTAFSMPNLDGLSTVTASTPDIMSVEETISLFDQLPRF